MALCIPVVVGPVNELMTSVHVQGALPGAIVTVNAEQGGTPRAVAFGPAAGGDDWLTLISGESLQAGDLLSASQDFSGQASPRTPAQLMVPVGGAPAQADLGYVGTSTHLYRCGSELRATGAYPGATVTASWGGVTHGAATAGPTDAGIALDAGLQSDVVRLRQSTPAGAGPETLIRPDNLPVDTSRPLPSPVIGQPLLACQAAIGVANVIDGATVTLTHADGTKQIARFYQGSEWVGVPALKKDDQITVRQDFPNCKLASQESPAVPVGPAAALPAPAVPAPLCAGAVGIRIGNLVPGAIVHVKVGSTTYTGMAPPTVSWFVFFVPPLVSGSVTATQELVNCGAVSAASSPAIQIDTVGAATEEVVIKGPLMSCGRQVPVQGAHIGGLLVAYRTSATRDEPISGLVVAASTELGIDVNPYLAAGDEITVRQWACSATPSVSRREVVQAHADPGPPQVARPAYAGSSQVTVTGVIPGALVDVYSRPSAAAPFVLAGSKIADSASPAVPLMNKLTLPTQLAAVQTICATQTEIGPTLDVTPPPPQVPVITAPEQGAAGVAVRPQFSWRDPGAGTVGAAVNYQLTLKDGATVVIPVTQVNGTTFTPAHDLTNDRALTLQVRAVNTSGNSAWAQVVFTTAPVRLAAPVLTGYDFATRKLTGRGFLPGHQVRVRIAMLGSSIRNPFGVWIPDNRDASVNLQSDASGNLAGVVVNPRDVLPILDLQDPNGDVALGVIAGETMHVSATDGRPNAADLTGFLWSNTLALNVPAS